MTTSDPDRPAPDPARTGAIGRAVAGDMTAIFGTGVRPPADPPPQQPSPRRRRSWRGLGVAAAGALALTVGLGVLAGRSVDTAPTAAPPSRPASRSPRPPAPSAPPAVEVLSADPIAETEPAAPPAAAIGSRPSPTPAPTAEASPSAAPEVRVLQRPVVVTADPPAPSPAPPRIPCDEDCLQARVEQADQRLDATFADAADAGVRTRTLRGYEREWDRARRVAQARPDEALRLYAMITSDLRTLTQEAARGEAR